MTAAKKSAARRGKKTAAAKTLPSLRAEIDGIDAKLAQLLNARAEAARQIGHIKRGSRPAREVTFDRPAREAEVVRRARGAAVEMNAAAMTGIFREIISACMACERPLRAAFLGPEGTFSHEALRRRFGGAAKAVAADDIAAAFGAVERGDCDRAVVPLENSSEGSVGATLDCLLETPLQIGGEFYLRIRHNLSARSGVSLENVRRIYSHPQSFAQCRRWLALHAPRAEQRASASNAAAAEAAAADARGAAVGPAGAAEMWKLKTLAAHIEDAADNTTRFILPGKTDAGAPTGNDKTSFVMSTRDEAGAMYHTLAHLAREDVNMTRLESRPARGGAWRYVFFVDVHGHHSDPPVARALAALKKRAPFLKMLGSYPREDGAAAAAKKSRARKR